MFAWMKKWIVRLFLYPLPEEERNDHVSAYNGRNAYVMAHPDNRR